MRKFATVLLAAGLAPLLTSCALLGIGSRSEPRIEAMSTLPGDAEAFVQFELARMSLASGNYARAIGEFSNARAEPALLGPALNGMAVAYARLGRDDLAERYFREAVAAEPGDTRFAANLLRLQQAGAQQQREQRTELAIAEAQVPDPVVVTANTVPRVRVVAGIVQRVEVEQPQARLARIDAQRVHLSSVVSVEPRNGAQVRLRLDPAPTLAEAEGTYPVRISLSRASDQPAQPAAGAAVRIGARLDR